MAPQNVAFCPCRQPEGGIGLAAPELFDFEISREACDVLAQIAFQTGHIEAMPLLDRHLADELLIHEFLSLACCEPGENTIRARGLPTRRGTAKTRMLECL